MMIFTMQDIGVFLGGKHTNKFFSGFFSMVEFPLTLFVLFWGFFSEKKRVFRKPFGREPTIQYSRLLSPAKSERTRIFLNHFKPMFIKSVSGMKNKGGIYFL